MRTSLFISMGMICVACADPGSPDPAGPPQTAAGTAPTPISEPDQKPQCDDGNDNLSAVGLRPEPVDLGRTTKIELSFFRHWGTADHLRRSYFDAVTSPDPIVTQITPRVWTAEEADGPPSTKIEVELRGGAIEHAGKTETFTLTFPDRRDHAWCEANGPRTLYELVVTVAFSADASTANAIFAQKQERGD